MLEYLFGTLKQKAPLFAVIECAGVGFFLNISIATYESMPDEGENIRLLTHLIHRDDTMDLYGFATTVERGFFRKLIGVTRVGPKLALSILSGCTPRQFSDAISAGDIDTLSKIPKVGKKTAERIVLELRGKLDIEIDIAMKDETLSSAVNALIALGFSRSEAFRAISTAKKNTPDASLDDLIRTSLQRQKR